MFVIRVLVCVRAVTRDRLLAWVSCPGVYTVSPGRARDCRFSSGRYDQETRPVDELFVLLLFLWLGCPNAARIRRPCLVCVRFVRHLHMYTTDLVRREV